MGFPENVKLRALIACRRQCVLCGKFCGTHMELHHIKQHGTVAEIPLKIVFRFALIATQTLEHTILITQKEQNTVRLS